MQLTTVCVKSGCTWILMVVLLAVGGKAAPLLAADKLVIGTAYKVLLSTPAQDGMLDRIAKEAFRRIGLDVELPYLPTERSIRAANDGLHDGELNRVAGMVALYPNLVRVDEPMMDFAFVGFTRNDAIAGGRWENLKPYQIGLIKGWKILETNVGGFPHLTWYHSAEDLFRGLDAGRVDVILYGKLIGWAVMHDLGLQGIRTVDPAYASRPMYMYLHRRHRELTAALTAALAAMKRDGTYAAIVDQALAPLKRSVGDAKR